ARASTTFCVKYFSSPAKVRSRCPARHLLHLFCREHRFVVKESISPPPAREDRMSAFRTMGLALALFLACFFPCSAAAKKVVLIIGNSDYRNVARLANPANDAALAVSTFAALGFQTSVVMNADAVEMRRALDVFQKDSADAAIAAIVFAGHGIQ